MDDVMSNEKDIVEIVAPSTAYLNVSKTGSYLFLVVDHKSMTIGDDNPLYESAVAAYNNKDWDALYDLIEPTRIVKKFSLTYEQIEVRDARVFFDGEEIHGTIVARILDFIERKVDILPLIKFLQNLMANPSHRAVSELYTFLENQKLIVTPEGNFVAYKSVREDLTDWHTGSFDNTVGNVLEMARNKVDDNKDIGCSHGFHAGSLEYASTFGNIGRKILVVEINPKDVVSIPTDCSYQKIRTCRYKVVDWMENPYPIEDVVYVHDDCDEDDCDEDEYYEDEYYEDEQG